jgi:ribosomal protein S18 acetylase RimI-like enzyme
MNFSIRQATEKDNAGLNVLFEEIDALHRDALPHVFRKPDGPARARDFLLEVLADQNAVIFIAEIEDKVIGLVYAYVRLTREIPIRIPSRVGEVDHLVVKQEYRREGVGKALMERVHQWAAQRNLDRLELSVWNFNLGAQDFYRELGYERAFIRMWKL